MIETRPNLHAARALAAAAFTLTFLLPTPTSAQVVKAPRYGSSVEAPAPQLNLPVLPPAITPHGVIVEDVVVRVNDNIISRSDVERSAQQMAAEAQTDKLSPTDTAAREKDMLRDMIDQQLLLSKAKELGLNADADVIRRLDDIRKQNKMETLDDLEKAARAQGVSFEDFKAQIRNQILTQQVVRDEVGRRLQISQGEEQKFYDAHKGEFTQPEQIRLSEILVPLGENATPAEIATAQGKANGLKSQVAAGGDFAEIAKKSSGGPSAAQGGELGLFKRGALAKVLEDQTFELKVGDSTQPIRTRQGFVILKVTAHGQAGPAPMKEVEPQIQEAMYMQQMQPALRAYLTRLREESYIDLQPGFVDSGASTRETKPVFTAYAPPAPKKKKVVAKARFDRHGSVAPPTVASPDATGSRTLTGAEAKPAVDPTTGLAVLPAGSGKELASGGKGKRIHREKVRFGQAPRNALPAGPEEVATGADTPATASAAAGISGAGSSEVASASPSDLSSNPLTPSAPERVKTRFASKSKEVKEEKGKTLSAKQQEKVAAKAPPMTADEKVQTQTQAAPLGLSGDTAKKKKVKKPKHVKGTPRVQKERLQDKPAEAKAPAPDPVAPTANPALAPDASTPESTRPLARNGGSDPNRRTNAPATPPETPPNSSVPRSVPNEPDTTLPPVTQPTPGSPQQGQPVPGTQPPA